MGLADEIAVGATAAIDTNAVIYYVERSTEYFHVVQPLWQKVDDGLIEARISVITMIEVLVKPLRDGQPAIRQRYEDLLARSRNVSLHELVGEMAGDVARVRAEFGLRIPDAVIVEMALRTHCDYLITNDHRFDRVSGIKVLSISNYV